MSTDTGTIVEVSTTRRGDELAADVAAGALTLGVVDAADFAEDGGSLTIGAEVLDYTTADDDLATVTLATPLVGSYLAGDRVELYPEALDKTAQVMVGDSDEAVEADVPHTLWDRIPDGIRAEGTGETVALELVGTEYVVTDVLAQAPEVDGSYIDPATLPTDPDLAQLQLDLEALNTDLHGPGGLDEQLTTVNTDLHGTGGLDDQLATLNTDVYGTGGVTAQLSTINTDLHGTGGLDEQLTTVSGKFPVATVDIADGAVTANKTSSLSADKIIAGTLGADRIAVNSLTGDKIIANTLSGDRVIANTMQGDRIVANTLSGDRVIANTLSGDRVIANTLSGDRVIANTLDASKIVAGSITTDRMTANSISGDRITGNTLDASKIVAGSITTDRMTANTINGDRIAANTLNASKIVAGSITTDRMTANTISGDRITGNTLDASKIVAGSITTDRMTANTINGDRITGGTITADKLSATAIDGKTITGTVLQTAASGQRIIVGGNAYANEITFWSGFETGASYDIKRGHAGSLVVDTTPVGTGAGSNEADLILTAPQAGSDSTGWIDGPQLWFQTISDPGAGNYPVSKWRIATMRADEVYVEPPFDGLTTQSNLYHLEDFDLLARSIMLGWGAQITGIDYGYNVQNTDANGRVQINHSLGTTPSMVLVVNHNGGGSNGNNEIFSRGPSSFQVQCLSRTGAVLAGGVARATYWVAFK